MAKEKQIGKITHYFGKIGVSVIELSSTLKIGDTIHITGGGRDFTQEISSMQIEHKDIDKAGAGEAIGLKMDQPVREGDKVFKVTE